MFPFSFKIKVTFTCTCAEVIDILKSTRIQGDKLKRKNKDLFEFPESGNSSNITTISVATDHIIYTTHNPLGVSIAIFMNLITLIIIGKELIIEGMSLDSLMLTPIGFALLWVISGGILVSKTLDIIPLFQSINRQIKSQ